MVEVVSHQSGERRDNPNHWPPPYRRMVTRDKFTCGDHRHQSEKFENCVIGRLIHGQCTVASSAMAIPTKTNALPIAVTVMLYGLFAVRAVVIHKRSNDQRLSAAKPSL